MKALKPQSRKLIVLVISAVAFIVNDLLGKPVTEESMLQLLGLAGVYILGQSVADHGAQGAATAAKRAIGEGKDVAAAVSAVLAPRVSITPPPVHDDEDDSPLWGDTSELDDADKPKG